MGRCLVLACGALAREVLAVKAILGLSDEDMTLQCLPAHLHNRPALIAPRVDAVLAKRRAEFDRVYVAYGDCGTGGALDVVLARHDAERLPHAHCYALYAGEQVFEDLVEDQIGSFFLTDFLARHFDRLVWQGLGLDRHPHLLPIYFGHYTRVVYLAQTDNPDLEARARAAAERLGLACDVLRVGYGDLTAAMGKALEATGHV
jgi:hypothetical protein